MTHSAASESAVPKLGPIRLTVLAIGSILAIYFLLFADLGSAKVSRTAAIATLMATLWITEAIPLAVTALLPVVLLPVFGVQNGKEVSSAYFNHIVFLFIGGFAIALAMQRWNLHRRIALVVLVRFGTNAKMLLLGFMLATAGLSMWISNTATTMMMVTIASAILITIDQAAGSDKPQKLDYALLLGTAYAASIGGIATLVGTPPNLSFTSIFEINFPDAPSISFVKWILVATPISIIMLAATWLLLGFLFLRGNQSSGIGRELLQQELDKMGPMTWPEWVVLADFLLLVILWITRSGLDLGETEIRGWASLFPEAKFINDGTVAIALSVVLFVIPARDGQRSRILDWKTVSRLPWDIVLLFGGGFALAGAFKHSGLSTYLGDQLSFFSFLHPAILVLVVCLAITFLTELTSNVATTEMILPVMASLAIAVGVNPLFLMVPVTISCSCAFMMPVATPPNAIVFGTGRVNMSAMVRTGMFLNFFGVLVVTAICYVLLPLVFGFEIQEVPSWALKDNP